MADTTTVSTVSGQVWPGSIRLSDELSIGTLDGAPEFTFGEVSRLAEDHLGGIYVFDRQAVQIRHYDRSGTYLGAVGRSGQGPGEYGPLSLGMVVDSDGVLYVHDWGGRRLVRFDNGGEALDPWPLASSYLTTARGQWVYSRGPGEVLVAARVGDGPALLVAADGAITDTLLVPELPGMPSHAGGPYSIDKYWAWHPSGCIVVGVSREYTLDIRCRAHVRRIRREVAGLPVHPDEAAAYRRLFEWMEQQPNYRAPEGEWIPSTMPPFRGIEVGSDGRIWVRRNSDPLPIVAEEGADGRPAVGWAQPFVYDVFEADGAFLGQVRFADNFEPYLFGEDYVWGVRRGELDEQYVVKLSMTPGPAGPE